LVACADHAPQDVEQVPASTHVRFVTTPATKMPSYADTVVRYARGWIAGGPTHGRVHGCGCGGVQICAVGGLLAINVWSAARDGGAS